MGTVTIYILWWEVLRHGGIRTLPVVIALKVRKLPEFCLHPGSLDAEDLYDSDQLLERKT